jgi:hypothetical protein
MRTVKVVESVDIAASRDEVFSILTNCDRRLQLSPLWGTSEIQSISPDFPQEGSSYRVKLREDELEYDTIVTAFVANQKFSYRLTTRREINVTWTVQEVSRGTRLIYREEFLVDETGKDDDFVQAVRRVVQQWLTNIKRYAELDERWTRRLLKWVLDHYVLKLRTDQRRVILILIALQAATILSFIALVIGWALISLLI